MIYTVEVTTLAMSLAPEHPPSLAPVSPDCWFLAGPTAAGKSALGLELAARLSAEIVSLDSMAVYREMDIGTAKPGAAQRKQVPHHLIDLVDPAEEFSLAQYIMAAHKVVSEIQLREKRVLFVGGTPLYLKALLRGIFVGPPADWEFRRRMRRDAEGQNADYLHRKLQAVDRLSAARLHVNDTRRIVRALEVFAAVGEPISELQRQFETPRAAEECRVFALNWDRQVLHRRIEARVDAMFAQGLVEEARQLWTRPGGIGRTARQALGYREVFDFLDGKQDLAFTEGLVKSRTRRFARRQCTWYRSLTECRSVEVREGTPPGEIIQGMLNAVRR